MVICVFLPWSHVHYDGIPAQQLQNLNALLGEDCCNVSQAYIDHSPEWAQKCRKFGAMDVLVGTYWCA